MVIYESRGVVVVNTSFRGGCCRLRCAVVVVLKTCESVDYMVLRPSQKDQCFDERVVAPAFSTSDVVLDTGVVGRGKEADAGDQLSTCSKNVAASGNRNFARPSRLEHLLRPLPWGRMA